MRRRSPGWSTCRRCGPWPSTSPTTWSAHWPRSPRWPPSWDVRPGPRRWGSAPATPRAPSGPGCCAGRRRSWSPPPSRCTCWSPATGAGRRCGRTETVIVDEIHAVARDKRGAHLALTLERLEALCDARPLRIGLSATQRPLETVGRLLVGDRPLPAMVDVGHQRVVDLGLGAARRRARGGGLGRADGRRARPHRRAGRRAPHDAGVRQHPPPGRAARPPARRASGRRRGRGPPRQPVQGPPLPGRGPAAGRASCGRWWPPPRWSSVSTSARSSWCARSARRAASPPSCSGSADPTTAGRGPRRAGCTR